MMKSPKIPAKIKTTLWSVATVLLLYTLAGFVLLPAVLSSQTPKLIQKHLKREAQVSQIRFNPFSLELSIEKFLIKNPDGSDFIRFERFYGNLGVLKSISEQVLQIDQVLLENPFVAISRDNNGRFNFNDLLKGDQAKTEDDASTALFPVRVGNIALTGGTLDWQDQQSGQTQRETVNGLNLTLDSLSTLPDTQSDLGISLHLASGGELTWQGSLSVNPLSSSGHVELNKVKLRRIWELALQDVLSLEPLRGQERIKADYRFADSKAGLQLQLDNAEVAFVDVKLAEKGHQDALIELPKFAANGIAFDLQKQSIKLASVTANKAIFKSWLNPDGSLNYQVLFASDSGETAASPSSEETTDKKSQWRVNIQQLAFDDFSLHFIDKTPKEPVHIDVTKLKLSSHNLDTQIGSRLPFELSLQINENGQLAVSGESVIEPFNAQLHIIANDIAIADFQPYIDQALKLDILSGLFHVDIDLTLQQPENQPFAISLQGNSRISEFASKDRIANRDFVKWQSLNLDDMKLDLTANNYSIETVSFDRPYARVLIRKDKSINATDIIVKRSEDTSKPVQSQTDEKPVSFRIGKIKLNQGETDFADLSLILPFSAHINQLGGSVDGISSSQDAVANVALAGKVDSLAPVNIEGRITPYKGDSEFTLDFSSMPMPLMTPYMAEFAGRKIEKGNMSLELSYKIENQQLTASNNLLIENLVLGENVENPQAVSLPLDFAIALLQDNDGKIALDVPITGSLEDPQFSAAGIIVDALVNVITKVVSSPFTALASLIDSDEDIGSISFPAGSTQLTKQEQKKLDDLVNILSKRPALKLEIKGVAVSARDWPPLQSEALNQRLQQLKAKELKQKFPNKPAPEIIKLSEEEYNRLLEDLFIQQYPQLAERSLLGTPRLLEPQTGNFHEIAKSKLASDIPPDIERLQRLANKRAQTIAKYLIAHAISVNRLFLLGAEIDSEEHQDTQLNLTVR